MIESELQEENRILKAKLVVAQKWMRKEIENQVRQIHKQKQEKENNVEFYENIEEIISEKVITFFGEILLLNIPSSVVENIVAAEVHFYHLDHQQKGDGLGVITSYHKALDTLIESFITKGFRKFANKKGQKFLRVNDVLEKSFHSIVTQGYIFSVGRLFHIMKLIHMGETLHDYGACFKNYLEKYDYLADILLDDMFYNQLKNLVESEIVGKKRHVGKVNYKETIQARAIFIGNFEDKNCLLYTLIKTQEVV